MTLIQMKRCTRCGLIKPEMEFSVRRKARDGRQYRCKECNKEGRTRNKPEVAAAVEAHPVLPMEDAASDTLESLISRLGALGISGSITTNF